MAATRFDTLAYAKRLREAGVDPNIAEAQALALAEVLKDTAGELATKTDLAATKAELKGDIKLLRWMLGFNLALTVAVLWLLIRLAGITN